MQETGGAGSIPGSRRSSGEGNGNPLQSSCLQKSHGERSLAGYRPWSCKESDRTGHAHMQRTAGLWLKWRNPGSRDPTPCFFMPDFLPTLGTGVTVSRQGLRTQNKVLYFLFASEILSAVNSQSAYPLGNQ